MFLKDLFKLVSLIGFSILVISTNDSIWTFGLLVLVLAVARFLAGQTRFWYNFKPLLWIFLSIVLFNLIFLTNLDASGRLENGLLSSAKILSFSLGLLVFNLTTSASRLVSLFRFLPGSMTMMLTITLSLNPLIVVEFNQIQLAQKVRGYHAGSLNPFKSIIPLLVPLLHRTLTRAEQIAIVMQARGKQP